MTVVRTYVFVLSTFLMWMGTLSGQNTQIAGTVFDSASKKPIKGAIIAIDNSVLIYKTDKNGSFKITLIERAEYVLTISKKGYENEYYNLSRASSDVRIYLNVSTTYLDEVNIVGSGTPNQMTPMPAVSGVGIYGGMKSEVIRLDNVTANLSTNNSRQVYNRIAGLNIWENDGAGIQLGIGARGLSPHRTSNFNVRQNLYDISADALGYPESYYTPSLLGVEKIQLIRGAAGLQYGTQFGGLLNFQMKKPPNADKKEIVFNQSIGSYGLNDTIASSIASTSTFIGVGKSWQKTGLYMHYQLKQGEGWRAKSDYNVHSIFGTAHHAFNEQWKLSVDATHMSYIAQQPGGLIDADFNTNPRQTLRYRNWFKVNWNIASINLEFEPNSKIKYEMKVFGLSASRDALGYLGQTNRPDPMGNRDLISSTFNNVGAEWRVMYKNEMKHGYMVTAAGIRAYNGYSKTQQGEGSASGKADFQFETRLGSENSDFSFPNYNLAGFAQTLIPISKNISITPGIRYEYIDTRSDGTFRNIVRDAAENIIEDTLLFDNKRSERDFLLFGIGSNYKTTIGELYMNFTQNYRAINFTDIQVRNTSLVIDPNIKDETGFNIDIGIRGNVKKRFQFDLSAFALQYNNRIGEYFASDQYNRAVRIRSNIARARTAGLELFFQNEISRYFLKERSPYRINLFLNTSVIDSRYVDSEVEAFKDKKVELVPNYTLRTGLAWKSDKFDGSIQLSLVGDQFSDATNVGTNPDFPSTANAVHGIIPSYAVADISIVYKIKSWKASFSVNNLLDEVYFTRRASGYPGPGIIPSDGRSVHVGIGWKFEK